MKFDPISVNFRYNFGDLIRAYRLYRARTLLYKVGLVLGLICLLLVIWYIVQFEINSTSLLLLILATLLLFDLVHLIRIWLAFKRNEELYTKEIEATFESTGLHSKARNAETLINWERFIEVIEGEHHFLLISGKMALFHNPKRAFKDPIQIDRARKMLLENIEKAK